MKKTMHTHRPLESKDWTYSTPIQSARKENPAAHGNITRVDLCRCGSVRYTNINGSHRERGAWQD